MSWLCHLLDPAYLYSTGRPWPGSWAMAGMVLIALLGVLLVWRCRARLRQEGRSGGIAPIAAACLGLGLLLFLAGPHWTGPLSARIAYLTPLALGLALPLLSVVRWNNCIQMCQPLARALACELRPEDKSWSWRQQGAWLALLGAGLYGLMIYEGRGWAPMIVAMCCLGIAAAAQWLAWGRPGAHLLRAEVLAPMVLPVLAYVGSRLSGSLCHIQVEKYADYSYADLLSPWFDRQGMFYAAAMATVLTTTTLVWRAWRSATGHRVWRVQARLEHALGVGLVLLGLGWYGAMTVRHLSHGATGSDPFCYLQMAIDLAERGTARHQFPLAEWAHHAQITVWPLVPVGYHPPGGDGWSATVWPIGWPLLLAPWYRLGGEEALLWAAPAMTILTVALVWAWAKALWPESRMLIAGVAGWLLLTSREVVWRSLTPMADGASMALSVLTMVALARAYGRETHAAPPAPGAWRWSALAGLALGMAYLVRHPLLPLFLAALPLAASGRRSLGSRALHVLALSATALLIALPDLRYHAITFGSLWTPESPEASLLSWRHVGSGLALFLDQGLLNRHEFGLALPLILYGLWLQVQQPAERPQAAMMMLGFGGVLLFGLAYSALRLRDLLALFPWLAVWAGRGVAGLWTAANRSGPERLARRAAALLLLCIMLGTRSSWTLQRLQDPHIHTFGSLSAAQRRAYDQLADLLPENAVVACGLGAGAVAHYTGHDTVRPASWSAEEFRQFVEWLAQEERLLYAVADGTEMVEWMVQAQRAGHVFVAMNTLNLPTFAAGGEPGRPGATLYHLAPE